MRKLIEITTTESVVCCDKCGKSLDRTPVEQAEAISIGDYDLHRKCLINILKKHFNEKTSKP